MDKTPIPVAETAESTEHDTAENKSKNNPEDEKTDKKKKDDNKGSAKEDKKDSGSKKTDEKKEDKKDKIKQDSNQNGDKNASTKDTKTDQKNVKTPDKKEDQKADDKTNKKDSGKKTDQKHETKEESKKGEEKVAATGGADKSHPSPEQRLAQMREQNRKHHGGGAEQGINDSLSGELVLVASMVLPGHFSVPRQTVCVPRSVTIPSYIDGVSVTVTTAETTVVEEKLVVCHGWLRIQNNKVHLY